ncbi:hypothetical protein AMECASPLE_025426 [Ameca splendens]|uniref:Uncharacterized protein n=1 Tax=Ameca splendens TaxID=208324 RepID=A0ABV0Z497_9TELE
MIGDHVTLLDPVEELCLFASNEKLARWASPVPVVTVVEEIEPLERWGVLYGQWHHGKSAVTPPPGCAGS